MLCEDLSFEKRLPPAYRDVWDEWVLEKQALEAKPFIEAEERRKSFIRSLLSDTSIEKVRFHLFQVIDTQPESDDIATMENGKRVSKAFKSLDITSRRTSQKYKTHLKTRETLPVFTHRTHITESVRNHQVVVLSGETGSGKSTQVPQFLLEQAAESDTPFRLICTQPRRISAVSLATRVSSEIGDASKPGSNGSWIGYQVKNENKTCASTCVTFCTTGILLRRMATDPLLEDITHIVVDEVHERTLDSDFLLFLLRRVLRQRSDLRVVLMSATATAELFRDYFAREIDADSIECLVVPGRTFFVNAMFMEDIVDVTGIS